MKQKVKYNEQTTGASYKDDDYMDTESVRRKGGMDNQEGKKQGRKERRYLVRSRDKWCPMASRTEPQSGGPKRGIAAEGCRTGEKKLHERVDV